MFEGKYSRILLAFLLGHLVVWTAIPAMIQPNLPLDCIEMAIWGHEWQLGYYKHPPLPAWIAKAFSSLSDNSEWPIYLASQICTVITMWCVWCVARVITPGPLQHWRWFRWNFLTTSHSPHPNSITILSPAAAGPSPSAVCSLEFSGNNPDTGCSQAWDWV